MKAAPSSARRALLGGDIPFALMGLALGIPLAMFLWDTFRVARAERIYARTPRTMPPLPKRHRAPVEERERSFVP